MATEGPSEGLGTGKGDDVTSALKQIGQFEQGIVPTPVTRVLRAAGRTRAFAAVYRRMMPRLDVRIARATHGWAVAHIYGISALLLNTTGAKSGQPWTNPVLYMRDANDFLVLGTNWGQPKHPGWTANLLAHPDATIEVGPVTLPVRAELLEGEDADRLFPRFVDLYPGYAEYLTRRGSLPPRMFRLTPAG